MTTKFQSMLMSNKNTYKIVDDTDFIDETSFLNSIAGILNSGVDVLELKFNHLSSAEILSVSQKTRELCSYFNSLLIIFDRIDIAKLVEADGVALNFNTISPIVAKKLIEDALLIGFELYDINDLASVSNSEIDFFVSENEFSCICKIINLFSLFQPFFLVVKNHFKQHTEINHITLIAYSFVHIKYFFFFICIGYIDFCRIEQ